jgi:type VI secretion system protein ImpE
MTHYAARTSTSVTRRHVSPAGEIETIETSIRREPAVALHRWALFQWLCVTGQWERAVQQIQIFAQLDPPWARVAQAGRELVRAELLRTKVMAGLAKPGFVFDDVPAWMQSLLDALELAAQGRLDASDDTRERALDLAPLVAGRGGGHAFAWIGDSDSRLGPVCEFVTAGRYRWLPLADIAGWRIECSGSPIDIVWVSCVLTLIDGAVLRGFMPARYPVSGSEAAHDREALQLGDTTVWQDRGRTGVFASGRKTWATSAGDFGLFELTRCTLGSAIADSCGVDQCTAKGVSE